MRDLSDDYLHSLLNPEAYVTGYVRDFAAELLKARARIAELEAIVQNATYNPGKIAMTVEKAT